MTKRDGRAMGDVEFDDLRRSFYAGLLGEEGTARLIEAVAAQRSVLRTLFSFFERDELRRVSTTDPVRNSALDYLKERVSMEDDRRWPI